MLSPSAESQARRLLAAARAESTAGDPEQAQVLLDRSRDRAAGPLHDKADVEQQTVRRHMRQPNRIRACP